MQKDKESIGHFLLGLLVFDADQNGQGLKVPVDFRYMCRLELVLPHNFEQLLEVHCHNRLADIEEMQ